MQKIFAYFVRLLTKEDMRCIDDLLHAHMVRDLPSDRDHAANYAYWERAGYSWYNTSSPIRPSAGDIAQYHSFLADKKKKKHVLLLGSTPELRDVVAEIPDAKIYLADFSHTMVLEMLKYTRHADLSRERWVKDNWLDLAFPLHFFDVILGDLVMQQFPPDKELIFLKKMRSLLHDEGNFIGRFQFLGDSMHKRTIETTVNNVLAKSLTEEQMLNLLRMYLPLLDADPVSRTLDRPYTSGVFREFLDRSPLRDSFLKKIPAEIISPLRIHRNWSPPDKSGLEKVLSSYFTIVNAKSSEDYDDAECYPLYVLKPRASGKSEETKLRA